MIRISVVVGAAAAALVLLTGCGSAVQGSPVAAAAPMLSDHSDAVPASNTPVPVVTATAPVVVTVTEAPTPPVTVTQAAPPPIIIQQAPTVTETRSVPEPDNSGGGEAAASIAQIQVNGDRYLAGSVVGY